MALHSYAELPHSAHMHTHTNTQCGQKQASFRTNGVLLNVIKAGLRTSPKLVVLLHMVSLRLGFSLGTNASPIFSLQVTLWFIPSLLCLLSTVFCIVLCCTASPHALMPCLVQSALSRRYKVVPDQHGYNQSEKPSNVESYDLDQLANNIKGIIVHYGHAKAFVLLPPIDPS